MEIRTLTTVSSNNTTSLARLLRSLHPVGLHVANQLNVVLGLSRSKNFSTSEALHCIDEFLPRGALRKRGLCRRAWDKNPDFGKYLETGNGWTVASLACRQHCDGGM